MIRQRGKVWVVLLLMLVVSGCAHLRPHFEEPGVEVVSLRMLPADGMTQRFAIGLRITNPNSVALNLAGMSYRLRLNDYDLLRGVANDIPVIEAFSETSLEVSAAINLLNSVRLVHALLAQPEQAVTYQLIAKLETRSRLFPAIRIQESGNIKLSP